MVSRSDASVNPGELISYCLKSRHAGHVCAESMVMAFKQESHCLHKSAGTEKEEVWLQMHPHPHPAPLNKKKKSRGGSCSLDTWPLFGR